MYILERAAHNFLQKHDRYPVIAIDHVEPKECGLGNAASPLLNLGRAYDPAAPSMRPVIILNDSQLEILRQGILPVLSSFLTVHHMFKEGHKIDRTFLHAMVILQD